MIFYFSPAKVNLFFKVLSKREDGYHDIASLYQTVSLVDHLSFQKSKSDHFYCFNNKDLKWDESNLIFKATNLFRKKTKITTPIEILLKKNIPIEAGLAGGSSNAATTLWALNELFDKPLDILDLIEIGKKIGADVPFFFSSGTAFCTGIGNVFENVLLKALNFYIAKPNFGSSTLKVYKNVKMDLLKKQDPLQLKKSVIENNFSSFNDLEISAFEIDKRLVSIKAKLQEIGFEKVVMTGSGSSFMCFDNSIKPRPSKEISFFEVFNIQKNKNSWYSF
ncbi:MAG: 4-diphosphocytidyl-2-C-methyl-D-erythritol kinase [Candidatus Anoxychlamydiales bacterium]|nr:4-diphosphocytidyl-2-C-methyl-D-erythritol kinase [Candidatus Anoxychlamydiales bacterium]NGX36787.1 4-diphosphocytidyl-2-C-methyl-D-erythritol kinase [Candidatus Anoxychlamydiales bacterium]